MPGSRVTVSIAELGGDQPMDAQRLLCQHCARGRAIVSIELRTDGRRAVLTVHDPWNHRGRIEDLGEKVDDLLQRGFTELVLQCEGVTRIPERLSR